MAIAVAALLASAAIAEWVSSWWSPAGSWWSARCSSGSSSAPST